MTGRVTLSAFEVERLERLLMDAASVTFKSTAPNAYAVRKRINSYVEQLRQEASCRPE